MSKIFKTGLATAAAMASLVTLAPMAAQAQANGVTNCDAPGGRQAAGALIGAVIGGVVGSNVARNERTAGTVIGAGAGAAAGSYIGCNQQRTRAAANANGWPSEEEIADSASSELASSSVGSQRPIA